MNCQQCWVLRYWLRETVFFLSLIWFLSLEIHQRRLSSDTCYWLCHNINTEMDKMILNTCLENFHNRKRKCSRMYRALLFIILHCFSYSWFDFAHSKAIESVYLVPLVSLKLMETWRVSFQSHCLIDFVVTLTCR
jgi:hypothetical protein